jgi:hypothetical protein
VAVRSIKLFRKMHGLEGIDGLTELQKAIYEFIVSSGGVKKKKLQKNSEYLCWKPRTSLLSSDIASW